jgi:hypothetical protein
MARRGAHVVPVPSTGDLADDRSPTVMTLTRRLDWASRLRRVHGEEVTQCPRCGDRLRVLAFITDPDVIARILDHLGLAADRQPEVARSSMYRLTGSVPA